MKIVYLLLQAIKKYKSKRLGMYIPQRKLEHRKYLTVSGIKDWDKLTLEDKLKLNIEF